eukprot:366410-Chlamydomonas_euryale.AAC.29
MLVCPQSLATHTLHTTRRSSDAMQGSLAARTQYCDARCGAGGEKGAPAASTPRQPCVDARRRT